MIILLVCIALKLRASIRLTWARERTKKEQDKSKWWYNSLPQSYHSVIHSFSFALLPQPLPHIRVCMFHPFESTPLSPVCRVNTGRTLLRVKYRRFWERECGPFDPGVGGGGGPFFFFFFFYSWPIRSLQERVRGAGLGEVMGIPHKVIYSIASQWW